MTIKKPYSDRLAYLRKEMTRRGLDAIWITRPENRRYLSNFSATDPQLDESSGRLLITKKNQYLLTDPRYELHAIGEAVGFKVVIYRAGPAVDLARLAAKHRIKKLGFEPDHLTVAEHKIMVKALKGRKLATAGEIVENMRAIKSPDEVRKIKRALGITEKALAKTYKFLKPGRTELEAARFLEEAMVDLGAEGPAFETIVASGPNAALPHAVPSSRKIRKSETIIIDCGAKLNGYGSDITRTFILGPAKPWTRKIYALVRQAQLAALKGIKPGMITSAADALARDVIEAGGYGPEFGHSLGHGVGLATHEAPGVSRVRKTILEPGMVVTVEPGIYLEGKGGVRLEEMIVLTKNGNKLLNTDKTFYDL